MRGREVEAAGREIARFRNGAQLHKLLRRRAGLPYAWANRVVRALKRARNPRDHHHRRRLMAEVLARGPSDLSVPNEQGYRLFEPDAFPGQARAAAAAREAFVAITGRRAPGRAPRVSNKEQFLVTLLGDAEFLAHPDVFRFAISRPLVDVTARYLGEVPLLSAMSLLWSPVNESVRSSQLFHQDGEGARQLKLFVHVSDVDETAGPLTIIPADACAPALAATGYQHGRLTDDVLDRFGVLENRVVLTAPRGAAAAVDTSRCLHYGSRRNDAERLSLMFQYTPATAPRARHASWGEGLAPYIGELDEVQRALLGLVPLREPVAGRGRA